MNVIFTKYRSLIPVTMFLEYFESGRCDSLTGPNGAYNLYEQELRGNMIIGELGRVRGALNTVNRQLSGISAQLNNISSDIKTIQNNQYLLYQTLEQGNDIAWRICSEAATIAKNTSAIRDSAAWTAYNSEITAHCAQSMSRIANYEQSQKYGTRWKLGI